MTGYTISGTISSDGNLYLTGGEIDELDAEKLSNQL